MKPLLTLKNDALNAPGLTAYQVDGDNFWSVKFTPNNRPNASTKGTWTVSKNHKQVAAKEYETRYAQFCVQDQRPMPHPAVAEEKPKVGMFGLDMLKNPAQPYADEIARDIGAGIAIVIDANKGAANVAFSNIPAEFVPKIMLELARQIDEVTA